jgi:hypothetical protein
MRTLGVARCPRCNRMVALHANRFRRHSLAPNTGIRCPLSYQRRPVTGFSDGDYEDRAKLVTDLAQQLQDYDPGTVYEYLTALPAAEVQRLLMVALAAIPLDVTLNELFRWVRQLPVAKASA